jgi:predicted glycosyltransferase
MRIIIAMGHPAHYHLFKHLIINFTQKKYDVKIVISDKDILKAILDENNIEYEIIAKSKTKEKLLHKGIKIFLSSIRLQRIIKKYKPDFVIGCLSQIAFASLFSKASSLFFAEDDIDYTKLQGIITYPFINNIISPFPTNVGRFSKKQIKYNAYQKLAYLHPTNFFANKSIISNLGIKEPYFILRLVSLTAHHDKNISGISYGVLDKIISLLSPHGNVYISAEEKLPKKYIKYILNARLEDIHHIIYFSKIFIGDSQSMAVESAMLGVPSIRFNSFAGKVSILEELEHKYKLTFGIPSSETDCLYSKIQELLEMKDLQKRFQQRRKKMLSEKINVNAFMIWFIENYPNSKKIMKENPDYQYKFK